MADSLFCLASAAMRALNKEPNPVVVLAVERAIALERAERATQDMEVAKKASVKAEAARIRARAAADQVTEAQASGVTQPSMGVTQPTMGVAQPTMGVTQPTMGVTQPSMGVVQPSMGVAQPTMGVAQPTMGVAQPTMGVAQPTMGVTQPTMGVAQPTMGVTQPTVVTQQRDAIAEAVSAAKDAKEASIVATAAATSASAAASAAAAAASKVLAAAKASNAAMGAAFQALPHDVPQRETPNTVEAFQPPTQYQHEAHHQACRPSVSSPAGVCEATACQAEVCEATVPATTRRLMLTDKQVPIPPSVQRTTPLVLKNPFSNALRSIHVIPNIERGKLVVGLTVFDHTKLMPILDRRNEKLFHENNVNITASALHLDPAVVSTALLHAEDITVILTKFFRDMKANDPRLLITPSSHPILLTENYLRCFLDVLILHIARCGPLMGVLGYPAILETIKALAWVHLYLENTLKVTYPRLTADVDGIMHWISALNCMARCQDEPILFAGNHMAKLYCKPPVHFSRLDVDTTPSMVNGLEAMYIKHAPNMTWLAMHGYVDLQRTFLDEKLNSVDPNKCNDKTIMVRFDLCYMHKSLMGIIVHPGHCVSPKTHVSDSWFKPDAPQPSPGSPIADFAQASTPILEILHSQLHVYTLRDLATTELATTGIDGMLKGGKTFTYNDFAIHLSVQCAKNTALVVNHINDKFHTLNMRRRLIKQIANLKSKAVYICKM
jgi:hypothetical protein